MPRVFISSTVDDLRVYREAARDAVVGAEMLPKMQEYFVASGDRPPLARCLAEVADTSCEGLLAEARNLLKRLG